MTKALSGRDHWDDGRGLEMEGSDGHTRLRTHKIVNAAEPYASGRVKTESLVTDTLLQFF